MMRESDEAKILTAWLDLHQIPYAWVPNLTTSAANAAKQKALGMQPGFPDYIIFYAPGRVGFWELKKVSKKPQIDQLEWLSDLDEWGHQTGWGTASEAIEEIKRWRASAALEELVAESERLGLYDETK